MARDPETQATGSDEAARPRVRGLGRGEAKILTALLFALSVGLMGFEFKAASPESQGMSREGLEALRVFSNELYPDNGLLVMRFDKVVLEEYAGGTDITTRRGIYSATKSFGAALVARAIDDARLSLSDSVCGEPGMSVFHLASFTGGLKKGGQSPCNDLLYPTGADWAYSDGSANRLGEEVGAVYPGVDLEGLMASEILDPIGATNFKWPNGERFSAGISIDTRGMARYGRLWLRGGNWDGNQILPSALVSQFTTASNPTLKEDYGLLWWVNSEGPAAQFDKYGLELNPLFPDNAPADAFLAAGCQYDFILVVPSLDLLAVRVGSSGGGCLGKFFNSGTDASDNFRRLIELSVDSVLPCGNGQLDAGEQCDDGNLSGGDCCSPTCGFEPLGASCDAGSCGIDGTCGSVSSCAGAANPCDDGLFCNGPETCDEELGCGNGIPPALDDGVACTDDRCDEVLDVVVHAANDSHCMNGLFCGGTETCDPNLDCQAGTPPVVDDGVACTIDICSDRYTTIAHLSYSPPCDDGDRCTADSCDRILGCVHDRISSCTMADVDALGDAGRAFLAVLLILTATRFLGSGRTSRAIS